MTELQFAIKNNVEVTYTDLGNGETLASWNNGMCNEVIETPEKEEVKQNHFEAGKTYQSYYISNGKPATFVCTEIDGRYAKGLFNGRKEKSYLIVQEWFNILREEEGLEHDFCYIIADKRASLRITSLQVVE